MDCYVVRIYRRITSGEGITGQVVGLLENVSGGVNTAPRTFSSFPQLIRMLKDNNKALRPDPSDTNTCTGPAHSANDENGS